MKSKSKQPGFWDNVKTFFAAGLGIFAGTIAGYMLMVIWSLFFIPIGVWLLSKNTVTVQDMNSDQNKGDQTKPPVQKKIVWNAGSIFGIILIIIGCLPWLPFIFQAFFANIGFNLGEFAWDSIVGSS